MTAPRTLSNDHISIELDGIRSQWVFNHPGSSMRWASPFPRVNILGSRCPDSPSIHSINAIENLELGDNRLKGLEGIRYSAGSEGFDLHYEWIITPSDPFVLWRWSLHNQRTQSIVLRDAIALMCANQAYLSRHGNPFTRSSNQNPTDALELTFPWGEEDLAIYIPGWQSWSYAGWHKVDDRLPRSWLRPFIHPMIYDKSIDVPRARGHFRSEMFMALMDSQSEFGIVLGYASQRESFGTTELIIQGERKGAFIHTELDEVYLEPDEVFTSDWACILVDNNGMAVVDRFTALTGRINQARIPDKTPMGWCSWYDYGQAISEDIIENNVEIASTLKDQLPLNMIQIDDGFQSEIGDWLTVGPNFKSGMDSMADLIHARDFIAGLWLAPFIGLRRSTTVRDHPEWVIRNRLGIPVNTGFVWNQFGRALDPSHPEFLDYLQRVISTATMDWGFNYLKLDFLYAGALPGLRYNHHLTRAQAFCQALQLIRETAGGSTTLVGCGCPLGPGIGIFDSMRISPDVAASWKPSLRPFTPFLSRESTLPAAVNSIRNTLNRAHMHRHWWVNDPDCVLVRNERSQLSHEEILSLVTAIGMSGGSVVLSDRLDSLTDEKLDLLGMLLPPLPDRMQLLFPQGSHDYPIAYIEHDHAIGKWWLVGCFNTTDQPYRFDLALGSLLPLRGKLHIYNVWQEMYYEHDILESLQIEVQGHSVVLLAMRMKDDSPAWIGDNIHISQGLAVEDWTLDAGTIHVHIKSHRVCDAKIRLFIPGEIHSAFFNGDPVTMYADENRVAILELESIDQGEIEIHWSHINNDY